MTWGKMAQETKKKHVIVVICRGENPAAELSLLFSTRGHNYNYEDTLYLGSSSYNIGIGIGTETPMVCTSSYFLAIKTFFCHFQMIPGQ